MMDCKSDRPAGGWGWGRRLQDKLVRGGGGLMRQLVKDWRRN